ncbi:unnamed protein product (mitochondrion) [Plasmodiophora brassicae]|uniref:Casein kinase I n=1 Tax=Plasmodiophora brassicae TaxID=37360 RepID=A0A0G4J816_PLABS|nr:hypothetical protein PBRA_003360 [Plasmodiophora brassicae]SPQ99710.1 unnamed protein product [Plasmodiophora brassicae]
MSCPESDGGASGPDMPLPDTVGSAVDGYWRVLKQRHLGSGHFGDVYEGEAIRRVSSDGERNVAIKISKTKISSKEIAALKSMSGNGAPKLYYHGVHKDGWHVVVMERCGKSLYSVIEQRSKTKNQSWMLTVPEAREVSLQALRLLKRLHDCGFVHADVKPANFVCGPQSDKFTSGIRLVDFGLSRPWRSSNGIHAEYWQHLTHFAGSLRYASLHAHLGRGLTRRDDLESLGYMMLYLMRGSLPWQGFRGEHKGKLICMSKGVVSLPELCRGVPDGLLYYMANVRALKYDEEPDYEYLSQCLDFERVDIRSVGAPDDAPAKSGELLKFDGFTRKRGERPVDTEVTVPVMKKHIVAPSNRKVLQWIIVSTQKDVEPIQEMITRTDIGSLEKAIAALGKSSKVSRRYGRWRIQSLCYAEGTYKAVMVQDLQCNNIKDQKLFRATTDSDFLDLVERLSKRGMVVTSVVGRNAGNSKQWILVGTQFVRERYENQMFALSETFPSQWVADNWENGFVITSVGAQAAKWAVVMSKSAFMDFDVQSVELSFCYPSESVRARWREGYSITAAACTSDQSAWVLSRSTEYKEVVQRCTRTSHDPGLKLPHEQEQNFVIDTLTFGRVE